jgi:hypothetical protein
LKKNTARLTVAVDLPFSDIFTKMAEATLPMAGEFHHYSTRNSQ